MRNVSTVTLTALLSIAVPVSAAPLMERTQLPFSEQDIQELKSGHHYTDEQVQEFLHVLFQLDVFADHANPEGAQRHNEAIPKIYYGAPFLTPSAARSVVGAEEYSESGMAVLREMSSLTSTFSLRLQELRRITSSLDNMRARIQTINQRLTGTLSDAERRRLEALRADFQGEADRLEQQRQQLLREGAEGAGWLPLTMQQEVVNAFILLAARLGITPTEEERGNLHSEDTNRMVLGMASMRARAANGEWATRQIIMEAGLTERQRSVLSLYLSLRPDVELRALQISALYVRAVAQTYMRQEQGGRQRVIERVPMMLSSVNGEPHLSRCGSTRSCNVVLGYTELGADRAKSSRTGPALIPVTFEADVSVAEPDFVGRLDCRFRVGWRSQGRADVRDGAIIYDGDVYNYIKTTDTSERQCNIHIDQGTQESAYYHLLNNLYQQYLRLHTERVQVAYEDRIEYERFLQEELQYHAQQSQERSDSFGDVVALFRAGNTFAGIATLLMSEAREFYWHTRVEDTSSVSEFHVQDQISVRNMTRQRRFSFDGFPLACWRREQGGGPLMMVACPPAYAPNRDTETSRGEENCPESASSDECSDSVDNAPTDEDGTVGGFE